MRWPGLLLLCTPLSAQPVDWSNPIATDRPAATDSSAVLSRGLVQLENGFLRSAAPGLRTGDFPETLLRFGLLSTTELRLTLPDYYRGSGFGDLTVGAKQQLVNIPRFQLAGVLSLTFPSGAAAASGAQYEPSIQLPWSAKLSTGWTAAGMLSAYTTARPGVLGETTFLLDRQFTRSWDAFVEYAGDFPDAGGPRHLLHFGSAYKLTPHHQVDLHGGVGLSAATLDHFIGVGYSFCFGTTRK